MERRFSAHCLIRKSDTKSFSAFSVSGLITSTICSRESKSVSERIKGPHLLAEVQSVLGKRRLILKELQANLTPNTISPASDMPPVISSIPHPTPAKAERGAQTDSR